MLTCHVPKCQVATWGICWGSLWVQSWLREVFSMYLVCIMSKQVQESVKFTFTANAIWTMGKMFLKQTSFKVGMALKKYRNKAGMKKLKRTTLQQNNGGALNWRTERSPRLFRFSVVFLSFSHPCLVSVLFSGPSLLEVKFSSETSSP